MQILVPGPHAMYVTKYATKPNKIEEIEDFEYTTKEMEIQLSERIKDTDVSEGFNSVVSALFIHNHGHVCDWSINGKIFNNDENHI